MQRAEALRQRAGENGGIRTGLLLTFRGDRRREELPKVTRRATSPIPQSLSLHTCSDTPGAPAPKNLQAGGKGKEGKAAFGLKPLLEMTNEGQTCEVYQLNKS